MANVDNFDNDDEGVGKLTGDVDDDDKGVGKLTGDVDEECDCPRFGLNSHTIFFFYIVHHKDLFLYSTDSVKKINWSYF